MGLIHRYRVRRVKRLYQAGYESEEIRERVNLPRIEINDLNPQESHLLKYFEESADSLPESETKQEPPKLRASTFVKRNGMYNNEFQASIEGLADEFNITCDFFKERMLCGDGGCWVCGTKIKPDYLFCDSHEDEATKYHTSLMEDKNSEVEYSDDDQAVLVPSFDYFQTGMFPTKLARWSVTHEDFQIPARFRCPKCEKRPHARKDYLCAPCRG